MNEDPEELFEIEEELGKGSYGSVYHAVHIPTSKEVALKVLKLDALTDVKELKAEITLLSKIRCTNVVRYYGSYIKNKALWISMEYCDAGSALDIMMQLKKPFTEQQIAALLAQALKGLSYLHSMSPPVLHRDIKAGNILLNSRGEVKLADFGVATQLADTLAKRQTQIGSPFWMAPEIIQESPYDTKVDIWSLGITAIELAQMKPPHWEAGSIRALFLIATKPSPKLNEEEKWGEEFSNFISLCVAKTPKDRPSATELLENSFIVQGTPTSHEVLASLVDDCFMEDYSERSSEPSDSGTSSFSKEALKALGHSAQRNNARDDLIKVKLKGEPVEGEQLTVEGDAIKSGSDQRFIWLRSAPNSDQEYTPIEGVSSKSTTYTLTKEDINCIIKCTVISESEGIENSFSATTETIKPGKPQIKWIKIEGGPYFTRTFKLNLEYFGGDEGESQIQWFKTTPDGKFEEIENATGLTYQPTSSDVSCRLEVKYIPIRKDGESGLPIFVVSKPILKVVGRIFMYTMAGCPSSLHAKYLLSQKGVPFIEVDLLKYPKRVPEMEKLTQKRTTPQIFFNKQHIGGLKELLYLEESGKLTRLVREALDSEPPDYPKPPTEDEMDIKLQTEEQLDADFDKYFAIYMKMRDPKKGVSIKIRGPITKRVKSFKASEFVKWYEKNSGSQESVIAVAQYLKKNSYIQRLKDNHLDFVNDQSLYQLQCDVDSFMLNMDRVWTEKNESVHDLASQMIRQILLVVDKFAVFNGKKGLHFNVSAVTSNEYKKFMLLALQLQKANLNDLKDKEKEITAFFINVYNALSYHVTMLISLGLVRLPTMDYPTLGRLGYVIGGQKYSLHDIKHGILRGNKKASKRKIKSLLSKHDLRSQFILKNPDPRIHFALVQGVRSNPVIIVHHPQNLEEELQLVTEAFLEDEVELDKVSMSIILPKLFFFYSKDFGKNDASILKWVHEHASSKKKEELDVMLAHKAVTKYSEYDWEMLATFDQEGESTPHQSDSEDHLSEGSLGDRKLDSSSSSSSAGNTLGSTKSHRRQNSKESAKD